jgi:hypothetical protein
MRNNIAISAEAMKLVNLCFVKSRFRQPAVTQLDATEKNLNDDDLAEISELLR